MKTNEYKVDVLSDIMCTMSIDEIFKQSKYRERPYGLCPLFKEEDIFEYPDMLTQLTRYMCVKLGITEEYFKDKWREYTKQLEDISGAKMHDKVGNAFKAITRQNVTFKTFSMLFIDVLGFHVELDISITGVCGTVSKFGSKDMGKLRRNKNDIQPRD